eukprot:gnl/TRDRNA2_/TRDRNA2_87115_c0_seq1.p1 gnl/TRDRNA2_/TRDRNA2_87115_c0~~gnl/TRDRNA2_/TRDRNA2_87115_c0_seq1.p1  ORF type:complete len:158 (+),score=34.74 gnl/TRDRNA2_/TRDRNA2_87115_c0_seq1:230-703(+)
MTPSNYESLSRLQTKYAEKPVQFLLFPCNQFGKQEPESNAEIKAFAESYVKLGAGSNVMMLAKTSVNNVTCSYAGVDACTPQSEFCCARNDAVYRYLLARTPPYQIKWNFDKIITDPNGVPYLSSKKKKNGPSDILRGRALDDELITIVEKLLKKAG